MRWLLFLSRLAFICGIFFLLSFTLLMYDWNHGETYSSTIVLIGHVMGSVIVPLVNLCYLIVFFIKRKPFVYVRPWLVVSNFMFLLIFIFYIFYNNG